MNDSRGRIPRGDWLSAVWYHGETDSPGMRTLEDWLAELGEILLKIMFHDSRGYPTPARLTPWEIIPRGVMFWRIFIYSPGYDSQTSHGFIQRYKEKIWLFYSLYLLNLMRKRPLVFLNVKHALKLHFIQKRGIIPLGVIFRCIFYWLPGVWFPGEIDSAQYDTQGRFQHKF